MATGQFYSRKRINTGLNGFGIYKPLLLSWSRMSHFLMLAFLCVASSSSVEKSNEVKILMNRGDRPLTSLNAGERAGLQNGSVVAGIFGGYQTSSPPQTSTSEYGANQYSDHDESSREKRSVENGGGNDMSEERSESRWKVSCWG